jgi:hypothetical protein
MSSERFLDGAFYDTSITARLKIMLHKRECPPALVIATLPFFDLADMPPQCHRGMDNTT